MKKPAPAIHPSAPDPEVRTAQPSERSRRVARNTVFLYFRMFLLMAIGLFTSRVVLQALGKTDVGVYNAVGGVVMMFTIVTNSLSRCSRPRLRPPSAAS